MLTIRLYFLIWLTILFLACKEDDSPKTTPNPIPSDEFKNPILSSGPDPWIFQKDDWYYVTHTTGNSIRLYRTKNMSRLSTAQVKTIWLPPTTGMNSRNIWAPEIHFIDNKWYVYYAADDGNNDNHRMWVIENSSADPFTGEWIDQGELKLPDDKWAIDGTAFEWQDKLYFAWSGWEGNTNVRQDIYIAEMTDPLTVTGARVMLSKPELAWELNGNPPGVNEGPQFIAHGDKMFITYSASGCWTDQYSLGILTASSTADPIVPSSWTKTQQPVFVTNSSGQAFGPGHNAFFKSPDGTEDWIVYHANSSSGQGCGNARSFRIQKFTWSAEGYPVFGSPANLSVPLKRPSGEL